MRQAPGEHGTEPVHGLPGPLPAGERILWQGAPGTRAFAVHVLHLRWLAAYFGAMIAAVIWRASGRDAGALLFAGGIAVALAAAAGGLLLLYAWLVHRTTVYTITNRRVAIRFGVALPATFNFPFKAVHAAGLNLRADGSGDLPLELAAGVKVGWLLLWPNVRPWRAAHPQPMLRAVPDAARVAQILSRALASAADLPVPVASTTADGAGLRAHGPALA